MEATILKDILHWNGHVADMSGSRIPQQVLLPEFSNGKRPKHKLKKKLYETQRTLKISVHMALSSMQTIVLSGGKRFMMEKLIPRFLRLQKKCKKKVSMWNFQTISVISRTSPVSHIQNHHTKEPTKYQMALNTSNSYHICGKCAHQIVN